MADQTTKPANLPRLSEPGTNTMADGPTQGQPDIPPSTPMSSALLNFAFNKFSRWIQYLNHARSNHTHNGGAGDLDAPKVDLNAGVSTGADGNLAYIDGDEFRIVATSTGAFNSEMRADEMASSVKVFSSNTIDKLAKVTLHKNGNTLRIEDEGYSGGDLVSRVTDFLQMKLSKSDTDYANKEGSRGLYSGENMFCAYARYQIVTAGIVNSATVQNSKGWVNASIPTGVFASNGILSIDLSGVVNSNNKFLIAQIHNNELGSDVYIVDSYMVGTTAKFDIRKLSAAALPLNVFATGATVDGTSLDLSFYLI